MASNSVPALCAVVFFVRGYVRVLNVLLSVWNIFLVVSTRLFDSMCLVVLLGDLRLYEWLLQGVRVRALTLQLVASLCT